MVSGGPTRGRILTVLNYYRPYLSGLSEYARLIAEGAASRGFSVTVLTGRHAKDLAESEVVNGVRVVRANPLLFVHKGYVSLHLFARFLREVGSADVAHFHLPMPESGPLSALCGRRVPLLATYHCDAAPSRSGALTDALAVKVVHRSCRMCLRRSRFIAVSSLDYACESGCLRGTSDKWVEIPPPDKGARIPPNARASRKILRVGFLGRFVEEKGIEVLLDAAPLVLRRLPGVEFILAGNFKTVAGGSEYQRLDARIRALGPCVQLPGPVAEEHLQAFYSSLDAFVLPSINSYEAFGMVQVEAMRAGVPVVASDMRGVRIPVRSTGNGILVPPGAAPALADAIVEVLTEARFRNRTEIFDRAQAAFPPDRAVERYVALYTTLIESRARLRKSP